MQGMRTMKQAKADGLIPPAWHNSFKDDCPECGKPRSISNTRALVTCSDMRCLTRVSHRASNMLENFGIKGFKQAACEDLLRHNWKNMELKTHIDILRYTTNNLPFNLYGEKGFRLIEDLEQLRKRYFTLGELFSMLAIPEFKDKAGKVFGGFSSYMQFLPIYKKCGTASNFLSYFGIYDSYVAEVLEEFLPDFYYAWLMFKDNIIANAESEIKIAITEEIYPYGRRVTKKEFISMANAICILEDGSRPFSIIRKDTAVSDLKWIVSERRPNYDVSKEEEGLATEKWITGRDRHILITSTDFLEWLKKEVESWKLRKNLPT